MKRGDVVLVVVPSELGRPRPGVIVQADEFNQQLPTIFICPISSDLQERLPLRPIIEVKPSSGLRLRSQIMTDKISALRRARSEIWPLRLSDSCFVTNVTLRSGSHALRESESGIPDCEPKAARGEGAAQNLTP